MNEREKIEQLSKAANEGSIEEGNDLDILLPSSRIFKLGDKEFRIAELPLKKMKLLLQMNSIGLDTPDNLDIVIELITQLLGVENKDLIDEYMTLTKALEYGKLLADVTYANIPMATTSQKKTIDSEMG